jgi:FOG: EAL domain
VGALSGTCGKYHDRDHRQASLQIDDAFLARLARIKEMGYRLAIDDFSMGNTSVKYLRSNVFDMIKLDGSLIRAICTARPYRWKNFLKRDTGESIA